MTGRDKWRASPIFSGTRAILRCGKTWQESKWACGSLTNDESMWDVSVCLQQEADLLVFALYAWFDMLTRLDERAVDSSY